MAHLKTHKCGQIAGLQLEHGATRATVAAVAEADFALEVGFEAVWWRWWRRQLVDDYK